MKNPQELLRFESKKCMFDLSSSDREITIYGDLLIL